MPGVLARILHASRGPLRRRICGIAVALLGVNLAAWAGAFVAFRTNPVLLGTALLAYGFGLRHAVDADHIAAIDNVTRKLTQEGKRPLTVGLWFSLGHSTVVVLASLAVAATTAVVSARFEDLHGIGGIIGTSVSALFLLGIATTNLMVLVALYRTFRRVRAGAPYVDDELNALLAGGGLLARLLRPAFRMIRHGWHMYPLGVLFGLGFDTATEIGLLGVSAAQASHGLSVWSVLVFPVLFTAGMALVDTSDGILMLGAYGWAFVKPIRKLYYNLVITFVSVIVAGLVGGVEALGLAGERLGWRGPIWDAISALNRNFGTIGYVIIGVFVACWLVAAAVYRARGYDRLEAKVG